MPDDFSDALFSLKEAGNGTLSMPTREKEIPRGLLIEGQINGFVKSRLLPANSYFVMVAQCNQACYILPRKESAMNTLHVRSVPDDLYKRLQQLAQARNRSLSAQVITMLAEAIEDEERRKRQARTLVSIQRRRFKAPRNAPATLDLLREDRRR